MALTALFLWHSTAEPGALDGRLTPVYARIGVVSRHHWGGSVGLRWTLSRHVLAEGEYLHLRGEDHSDRGWTAHLAFLSSGRKTRASLGVGGGRLSDRGDGLLVYLSLGAVVPLSTRVALAPEFRAGALDESGYVQLGVGLTLRLRD